MQMSPFTGGVIVNVFPDAAELVMLPERRMFPLTSSFAVGLDFPMPTLLVVSLTNKTPPMLLVMVNAVVPLSIMLPAPLAPVNVVTVTLAAPDVAVFPTFARNMKTGFVGFVGGLMLMVKVFEAPLDVKNAPGKPVNSAIWALPVVVPEGNVILIDPTFVPVLVALNLIAYWVPLPAKVFAGDANIVVIDTVASAVLIDATDIAMPATTIKIIYRDFVFTEHKTIALYLTLQAINAKFLTVLLDLAPTKLDVSFH